MTAPVLTTAMVVPAYLDSWTPWFRLQITTTGR